MKFIHSGVISVLLLVGCSSSRYIEPADSTEYEDYSFEAELDLMQNEDFLNMKVELEKMNSKINNLESEIESLKEENEELLTYIEDLELWIDHIENYLSGQ
jgi:peptidoglycan hydrolase CwlO-like protein